MHLRHRLQYGAYAVIRACLLAVPHRSTGALGRGFGGLAFRARRRERSIALDNLAAALPELGAAERRELARRSFREVGAAAFESLSALRFTPEALRRHLVYEGFEHLERAQARGRGVLLMGAHLGCWEIAAFAVALELGSVHVVSNVLHNPLFDRALRRLRQPYGIEIIERQGAARRMYKLLIRGGRIGVALDQRTKPHEAIQARFFGLPSLTSPLPAYLSLWAGASVVPVFVVPEGDRYRVTARPAIEPEEYGVEAATREAIARLTQRYLDLIEAEIRRQPERWVWFYRRWRPLDATAARSSLALRPGEADGAATAEAGLLD